MRATYSSVGSRTGACTLAGALAVFSITATPVIAADSTIPDTSQVVATDSTIPDTSASDTAPNMVPQDAGTPTKPANDIDDRRVTAQIRTALVGDKSLSSLARNVGIATNQQAVVLRGQVTSGEKDRVEALASQYAGTRQVVSQLLVKDP